MPLNNGKMFSSVSEKDVTRALVREFAKQFDDYVETDVLITGAGPSGLMCGKILAEAGVKVMIIERNNYLGGGFWIGGYLMNKVVLRAPSNEILDDLGVPNKEVSPGLYVADGPHACSKLIAAACDAGVKVLNMTSVDDVVLREENRVSGLVINWTPIQALPRQITCVDPVAIETKLVIDATGHDAAVVKHLADRGILNLPGNGAMWVERSEEDVVNNTGIVHPGLMVIGMSVAAFFGLPRMGPSFGAMLMSGIKGAKLALEELGVCQSNGKREVGASSKL
ncbi:sulfide-dependent adenosine diphosphate thiazole synthase [bacterium]|nr:sulfide-dependent adenosine diphosphate thiazole synthase [bacterium]MBU1024980.1 sulfide-dependent adenosine diphosphate thiazole synthase [bacterium]